MNNQTNVLGQNLTRLRKYHRLSQEKLAEEIGVTRQAVAKWENGETLPDLLNCVALAKRFDITLDDLARYDEQVNGLGIPPKGKHMLGTVAIGDRGQLVLPKRARDMLGLKSGDLMVVLLDEASVVPGVALVPSQVFTKMASVGLEGER